MSEIITLILPLSLFLSILITFNKLYLTNEITAMHACGLGKNILLKTVLLLIFFTIIFEVINIFYTKIWFVHYQNKILNSIKKNDVFTILPEKKLHTIYNVTLFVNTIEKNNFNSLFIAKLDAKKNIYPAILLAKNAYIKHQSDGTKIIICNEGIYFEDNVLFSKARLIHFKKYFISISQDHKKISRLHNYTKKKINQFLKNKKENYYSELHWKWTIMLSIPIMSFIVIPLSMGYQRKRKIFFFLPSIILYFILFLLQNYLKFNISKGKNNLVFWMWLINILYLLLAIVFNLWDTVAMRSLRIYISKVGKNNIDYR